MHGHAQDALGAILANDILIEVVIQLARGRHALDREFGFVRLGRRFLLDELQAQLHALVADEHAIRPRNEVLDLMPRPLAERTALIPG